MQWCRQFCDLKYYEYVADHEYERSRISKCMRCDQKKKELESKIIPRFRAEETGCIVVFEEIVSLGL